MRAQVCTSVDELMANIERDATRSVRWPSRFILVKGLEVWSEVITHLGRRVSLTIRLSELCRSDDVLPDISDVGNLLLKNNTSSVMVLPVSEVMRFRSDALDNLGTWMELENPGKTRYYFPLFDFDDSFMSVAERVHRYKVGELPRAWGISGVAPVSLEAAPFAAGADKPQVTAATGIREYLSIWENGGDSHIRLKSRQTHRLTPRIGALSIATFLEPLDCLSNRLIDLPAESATLGEENEWSWLLEELRNEDSIAALASRILNVRSYDKWHVFGKWEDYSSNERWLSWLWARICEPDSTYFGRAINACPTWQHLSERLVMDGFEVDLGIDDLDERKRLLSKMAMLDGGEEYWRRYENTKDDMSKLRALWGISARQKKEAIYVVARLLRGEVHESKWHDLLDLVYPQLASYLRTPHGIDKDLERYLSVYVRAKITSPDSCKYLEEIDRMAKEALESKLRLDYFSRERLLESNTPFDHVFWVDAMGLEWLELLQYELDQYGVEVQKLYVGRSNLPSITETNKGVGWEMEHWLERQLDTVSHKNTYQSIADLLYDQFDVIARVAARVSEAVYSGKRIAITADHGLTALRTSTRLACIEGMDVHNSGRFGSFESSRLVLMRDKDGPWVSESCDGREHVCLADHSRFRGGRSSSYEEHGGATIEESLVPVLFVTRYGGEKKELPKVSHLPGIIPLDPNGEGIITVSLDGHVESLAVRIGPTAYHGVLDVEHDWEIEVSGVVPGTHSISILVGNTQIHQTTLRFIKGIVSDDMGI